MNKIIQIVSLLMLLGANFSKTMDYQAYFDEKFLGPLVNLVKKDAETKLATLYKQKEYLENKLREDGSQYAPLYIEKQRLQNQLSTLNREQEHYQNRYRVDLYSAYQEDQIKQQMRQVEQNIKEVDKKLSPYEREKRILKNDLEFRIGTLMERASNPVDAVFYLLKNVNFDPTILYTMQDPSRAGQLQFSKETYSEVETMVKNALPEEYVNKHLNGQWAVADDNNTLRQLISSLAASLALQIKKEGNPYDIFNRYMKKVENNKKDAQERLENRRFSGVFYSIAEPESGLSSLLPSFKPTLPTWMSQVGTAAKDYLTGLWQRAKQQGRLGAERSLQRMAPENTGLGREYEIERALQAGQDFVQPMPRRDYGFTRRMQQMPIMRRWAEPSFESQKAFEDMERAGGY